MSLRAAMAAAAGDVRFVNPLAADDAPTSNATAQVGFEAEGGMGDEMATKSLLQKFAAFIGPGNVSAGAASALHVNIYLFALGMMLASPYYVRCASVTPSTA